MRLEQDHDHFSWSIHALDMAGNEWTIHAINGLKKWELRTENTF